MSSFVNSLYERCIETNPHKRISMKELYNMVSEEERKYVPDNTTIKTVDYEYSDSSNSVYSSSNSSQSSSNISHGGNLKMKKTNCDKVPKYMLRVDMNSDFKRKLRKIAR